MKNSKARGKTNKNVTTMTSNLSVTDNVRSSVVVNCHQQRQDKGKDSRSKIDSKKKDDFHNLTLGEDHFPALENHQVKPQTLPNQKGNMETNDPQRTYAQMLTTTVCPNVSASKMPTMWNKLYQTGNTKKTPSEIPAPRPEVTPSKPATPPGPPMEAPHMNPAEENALETARNLQPVERNTSTDSKNINLTQENLPPVSENELQKTLGEEDKKVAEVQQPNAALLNERKRLTELKNQVMHSNASLNICQLEAEKCQVKAQRETAEMSLVKQREETSKVKAALAQVQTLIETQQKESMEEKTTLKREIEQLKQEMESYKTEKEKEMTLLYEEVHEKDKLHADAATKVNQLQSVINAERTRKNQADAGLSQKTEEACKLKDALVQMQQQIQDQKDQWEQDKSRFQAEKVKTVTNMNADIAKIRKVLEDKQLLWYVEKAFNLETIATLQNTLLKKEEERNTSTKEWMDRIRNLEEQIEMKKKEKTKKKSLWARILRLFK